MSPAAVAQHSLTPEQRARHGAFSASRTAPRTVAATAPRTVAATPRRAAAEAEAATASAEDELAAFQHEMESQMAHQVERMRRMRQQGTPSRAQQKQQQQELTIFDQQMRDSIARIQSMREVVIEKKRAAASARLRVECNARVSGSSPPEASPPMNDRTTQSTRPEKDLEPALSQGQRAARTSAAENPLSFT